MALDMNKFIRDYEGTNIFTYNPKSTEGGTDGEGTFVATHLEIGD